MSLDTVELVMKIEDEFDIIIPDTDKEQILTLAHLRDCVLHLLCQKSDETIDIENVWGRVQLVVQNQSGIEIEKLVASARIVDDLGLD